VVNDDCEVDEKKGVGWRALKGVGVLGVFSVEGRFLFSFLFPFF
jgi:hypothetical protein